MAAEAKRDLHTKEAAPPRPGYNNYWVPRSTQQTLNTEADHCSQTTKGNNRPSACFLKKGKPVTRDGVPMDNPGPTHYTPKFGLTKKSKTSAFVTERAGVGVYAEGWF